MSFKWYPIMIFVGMILLYVVFITDLFVISSSNIAFENIKFGEFGIKIRNCILII